MLVENIKLIKMGYKTMYNIAMHIIYSHIYL